MNEKTLTIASFKFGLDTRRDSLVEQPGTLASLINAHINNGGEIEKRQALVDIFAATNVLFTNTFGCLAVVQPTGYIGSNRIVVFADYNATLTGTWATYPSFNAFSVGVNYSIGVSCLKCRHPKGAFGGADDILMTGIMWAINFGGKPLVCAKFQDGNAFLYWGGSPTPAHPIDASAMGLVYPTLTAGSDLASQLAYFIDNGSQTGGSNGAGLKGWKAVATSNYVDIKTPPGVTASFSTLTTNDPSQTISAQHIGDNFPGTPGSSPSATLTITAAGATGDVWTATANGVQIGQYTQLAGDTPTLIAAGIAASINATVPGSGPKCTATSAPGGGAIFCQGPVGNTTLNTLLFGISTPGVGTINATAQQYANATPTFVSGDLSLNTGTSGVVVSNTTVATAFGIGVPTAYAWQYVSGDTTIQAVNPDQATTAFRATVTVNTFRTAIFNCKVTGPGGTVNTGPVSISLTCDRVGGNQ